MATPTAITTGVTTDGESSPVDRPEPEEFLKPGLGTTVPSVGTTEIRNTVNHGIQFHNLNAEGAKHFAQVLKYDNSLKWVNLYENRVCDRGAKDLAEMLKVNGSLKKMNLFGNNTKAFNLRKFLKLKFLNIL